MVAVSVHLPIGQSVQPLFEDDEYRPAAQVTEQAKAASIALVAAAAVDLPSAQTVHSLWPVAEVSVHLPIGQSVHAETPVVSALYLPARQSVQVPNVAEANWYFPTEQLVEQAVAASTAEVTAAAVVLPSAQTVHIP